jgi:sensor histidine kinase regulating citrate/malate metabolism
VVAVQEYAQVFETKLSGLADLQPGGETIDPEFVADMTAFGNALREGKLDPAGFLAKFDDRMKSIMGKALEDVLSTTISGVMALAEELEKPAPLITISQPFLRVPEDVAPLLQNVFVHVFRNSVDHGLESADERRAAGKDVEGQITLEAKLDDDKLIFQVYDDGRGLNITRLKEKAVENGGAAGSDQEAAEMIFASGMSTAQAVTDISGRGVGMDAIRKFLEERGGSADIHLTGEITDGYRPFKLVFAVPL